jgi:glycosyltransferase involved in cell wall biosynthesis
MNILHIIENLNIGGAQVRLLNDLKFIDKKRFNNTVCSLSAEGKLSTQISALGVETYSLNRLPSWKSIFKLAEIIRKNRIDVIHTQLFFSDLYGRFLGKILRVPAIVTTVQSSVYEPDNNYLYSLKRKLLDSYSGRLCNRKFIAVSEFVKCSISKHLKINPGKIEVIPNYVDIEELSRIRGQDLERIKRELSIQEEDIVLITVGRLNPAKGIQYLLLALAKVITDYKNIKLFVVGDGFYRKDLERQAQELGLEKNVIFLGERDDVRELLHLSDIFVLPTLSEGLPVSLLEAMAVGIPAIASDIGPVCEIIKNGETGILFKAKDGQSMTRAIVGLISNLDKAKELGERGKNFVKIKYDPLKNAKLLEQFYMGLS